jgi:putative glutamine transport system permease protein
MFWTDIINNWDFLMKGLFVTLQLSVISITASLVLGIFLGLLRYSRIFPINGIATALIELIRSIPLILFIIFVHFGLLPAIFGAPASFFQSSCVALSIFTSAYVAEIIRGGLKSIESGHIEAAKSLGLNYFQRITYVILPLAITRMMPALVSQFISLIKDTSLASTIGLIELTRSGEIIYERTYHELEILLFIALIYFILCYSLSFLSRKFETKSYYSNKLQELTIVN